MDEIIIEDIEVFAHHGVFDFERINGQNFYITAKMMVNKLTTTDDLADTVDYGSIADSIANYVSTTEYNLIESVAHGVARMILLDNALVESVEVTIKKPDAPIKQKFGNVMVVVRESRHKAYIALGSNMGDREAYLDMAVNTFDSDPLTKVAKVSSYINTAPYGVTDQADFLNGVMEISTLRDPHELLDLCHDAENNAHRVRVRRWGERTLDADILLYDDIILNDDDLIIPHLEMHMRDFVLKPLVEIASGVVHPVLHKTAYTLLKELEG